MRQPNVLTFVGLLACASILHSQTPSTGASTTGGWRATQTKDEITDEVRTAFTLAAANTVLNAIGLPSRPILVIRCNDGAIGDIYVTTHMYVGDEAKVQYRFDLKTPSEGTWIGGRARDALFAPSAQDLPSSDISGRALASLDRLSLEYGLTSGKGRFTFRWFPPREDARTATFSLAGFKAMPQAQLQTCGLDRQTVARREIESRRRLAASDSAAQKRFRILEGPDARDSTLPWIGERGAAKYWKNVASCYLVRATEPRLRVYFRSEEEAKAAGFGRKESIDQNC